MDDEFIVVTEIPYHEATEINEQISIFRDEKAYTSFSSSVNIDESLIDSLKNTTFDTFLLEPPSSTKKKCCIDYAITYLCRFIKMNFKK